MKASEKKILEAATWLFSEKGYDGVSTKEIAEKAGVNEITIFRNFKSKSNLLQAVIKDFSVEGNIIEKIAGDITGDIMKDFYIMVQDYYMFLRNNVKMYKIQIREISDESEKFTNSVAYRDFIIGYLTEKEKEGVFKGDKHCIATLIVSSVMGAFTFEMYSPSLFNEPTRKRMLDYFVLDLIDKYVEK